MQGDRARRAEARADQRARWSLHAAPASGVRNCGGRRRSAGVRDQRGAEGGREHGDKKHERTAHLMIQRANAAEWFRAGLREGRLRDARRRRARRRGRRAASRASGSPRPRRSRRSSSRTSSSTCGTPGSSRASAGREGGYWLARPADEITLADVIRAVDGPLANVRGVRPEQLEYAGTRRAAARRLGRRAREPARGARGVTLADVAGGELPRACRSCRRPRRLGAALTARRLASAPGCRVATRTSSRASAGRRRSGPRSSSSRSASSRVSCAESARRRRATSSTRTSKPSGRSARPSPRASCRSASGRARRSCGRTQASPKRFAWPTNAITNSFAGSS